MILTAILVPMALVLFVMSGATLWWMSHAWRTPETYRGTNFPAADEPMLSFSIIVPCRDESEEVMASTLFRLLEQTHPRVEVIISVGDDDTETVANAHRLAEAAPDRVRVSINDSPVKNKPRQLNSALAVCRNEIVGVMDAESLAPADLLRRIDSTFRARRADVVQGAVHLVNYRSRWFTLRNCMEYRIWFRSRLHGHADAGFIPLGGNTVFIHRRLLEEVGGWDGDCLAEDCDLGVRMSALGRRVVCVYDRALVTLEEAPTTVPTFLRQRVRWAVGFMQVLHKGAWKELPTFRRRAGAWWTLCQQYSMAFAGLVAPIGFILAVAFKAPAWVALVTYLPLVPASLTLVFECLALEDFGRDMRFRVTARDYAVLILSTPFYQALLAYAAMLAVVRYARGQFAWDKTPHSGAHLGMAAAMQPEPSRSAA
jgi:cellulose synthase/poly-beta-1,6-N-acetylglucosamine synthase-like glycosyltransferase